MVTVPKLELRLILSCLCSARDRLLSQKEEVQEYSRVYYKSEVHVRGSRLSVEAMRHRIMQRISSAHTGVHVPSAGPGSIQVIINHSVHTSPARWRSGVTLNR